MNSVLNGIYINSHVKFIVAIYMLCLLVSCSLSRQISRQANNTLLKDPSVSKGQIGISIYEPLTDKYWYAHDASKYLVPASNTKLFTLYAGLKYLGDSLTGLKYQDTDNDEMNVYATGDPTFLHSDFKTQPVLDFLLKQHKKIRLCCELRDSAMGYGWPWDDYNENYAAERSSFPIYGNIIKIAGGGNKKRQAAISINDLNIIPSYFKKMINHDISAGPGEMVKTEKGTYNSVIMPGSFTIKRSRTSNTLETVFKPGPGSFQGAEVPFYTDRNNTAIEILRNDYGININKSLPGAENNLGLPNRSPVLTILHSQPTDSLFVPMMHRSDNFFAEQTLLMVSNEYLGFMSDAAIIDTLLKTDLKDIPEPPKWVDGSGLSRYNLFTPNDFVYILKKMKNDFGLDRLKNILPTGGTGTLSSYYKKDAGYIFAKTGSLSNHCALSGFLVTKRGKLLIFSILANHFPGSATPVRRAVEHFLEEIREKY